MAAIGRIRKHGVLLMIIIGLALLAFIVGDLTNVVNTGRNTVVRVGDTKLSADQNGNLYSEYYQQNLEYLKVKYVQNNQSILLDNNAVLEEQAHNLTWMQIKREALLDEQLADLGMTFTKEMKAEISENVLKSEEMSMFVQYFLSEEMENIQDGQSANYLYQAIGQAVQSPENMETKLNKESNLYKTYKAIERSAILQAKENAYFGMASTSIHFSQKMMEQMAKENDCFKGQMVAINFDHPEFDKIKVEVSDSEAKAYFKEHKDRYTLRQDVKNVDLAMFVVNNTPADDNAAKEKATELYNKMVNSPSIADFTANQYELDKIDFAYGQNSNDPYSFNYSNNSTYASFAQVDTTLYLKKGETAMQKRNSLSLNPKGYSAHASAIDTNIDNRLHPAALAAPQFIEPMIIGQVIYFGQLRDVQNRPDSIRVARLFFQYTDEAKGEKEMTEEQAMAKALEVKAQLDGKDTNAILPYLKDYSFDTVLHPFYMVDGASFDALGRLCYSNSDTANSNQFNNLINVDTNHCFIRHDERNKVISLDMVISKSAPIAKSQYVLYPVPMMPSTNTSKDVQRNAAKAANCQSANDLAATASKLGGQVMNVALTNMQGTIQRNSGFYEIIDCREAVKWVYSDDKKAGNEVGSVASNPFKGSVTYINPMTGESMSREIFIVAGIKSSISMKKPSFNAMKETVIADLKAEKKKAAVMARLKKEFNGSNLAEMANKYGSRAQMMNVFFSEYDFANQYEQRIAMESAAIGKISTLAAGKHAVVDGEQYAYIVKVDAVEKSKSLKEQTDEITKQIVAMYQVEESVAKVQAKMYASLRYQVAAYQTALINTAANQGNYPVADVVKELVYNNLENDTKVIDHRHVFYGAADNTARKK